MSLFWPLATLWIVHLMAVMSPGQAFVVVSRTALQSGRGAGIAAALGMGVGILPWAIGAMLGLAVLFDRLPWLYAGLRVAGGLYLLYVAFNVWRHAAAPIAEGHEARRDTPMAAFRKGLFTQVANPKVAIFFASIFVAVLPPGAPLWLDLLILGILAVNEVAWYTAVSVLFSTAAPRRAYLAAKAGIDRVMAGALGILGGKLIEGALH
jgi:threonine/homoserine/homoserine lactone efflux protein